MTIQVHATKHVIGPVGSGKMKIVEFFDKAIDDSLPFDVVDDITIFMRNDPLFYRKEFYPTILKLKDLHNKNKTVNPHKMFGPVIDRACESYCREFKINRRPEELMSLEERKALVTKLFSEEMTNIRKGEY